MTNQEKTHHHYVPQVYLRKFYHTIEEKKKKKIHFVTAYDKLCEGFNEKLDVYYLCAKNKLYTLEAEAQEERESVENFYADYFESKYNNLYKLLTDSSKTKINFEERELIISWVVSLHFRNHFWLKSLNDFSQQHIAHYGESFKRNVYTEGNQVLYNFENQSKEEILSKEKAENKQIFIDLHLEKMVNLTKVHFADTIVVEKLSGEKNFITSDKPVIWGNYADSLRLPLDSKHFLTLQHKILVENVQESNIERMPCLTEPDIYNVMQYENAERHVIGYDAKSITDAKATYNKIKENQLFNS